jgi:hypothetical protein
MGDQPAASALSTHRTTQTESMSTQTSLPRVGFEPMTPVFEQTRTIHVPDRASTVIVLTLRLQDQNT